MNYFFFLGGGFTVSGFRVSDLGLDFGLCKHERALAIAATKYKGNLTRAATPETQSLNP